MAPLLAVHNTFLEVVESHEDDTDAEELATSRRPTKRAHTTGSSAILASLRAHGEATPSTSCGIDSFDDDASSSRETAESEASGRSPKQNEPPEQEQEEQALLRRTVTFDPWEMEEDRNATDFDEDEDEEDCPPPLVRAVTFDPWEMEQNLSEGDLGDGSRPCEQQAQDRISANAASQVRLVTSGPQETEQKHAMTNLDEEKHEEGSLQPVRTATDNPWEMARELSGKDIDNGCHPRRQQPDGHNSAATASQAAVVAAGPTGTAVPSPVPMAMCAHGMMLVQPQLGAMPVYGLLPSYWPQVTPASASAVVRAAPVEKPVVPTPQQLRSAENSSQSLAPRLAAPAPGFKAVICSPLPNGGVHIRWDVDSRRFAGHDTTVVSPAFDMELPGFGCQHFKIVVHSATTRNSRGGSGFRVARGHGRMELKCDMDLSDALAAGGRGALAGTEFEIVVEKHEGTRLGVDLASQDGEPWWIKGIAAGLIEEWNHARPEHRVGLGDRILEVNGVREDVARVREECGKSGTLRIRIQKGNRQAPAFRVSFGVGAGGPNGSVPSLRGPVSHRFSEQSCCGLPRSEEEFDFLAEADKTYKKVAFHIEVTPAA